MTLFGWIVFALFTLVTTYFTLQLVRDFLWNRKLRHYQKTLGEILPKARALFWIKRSYGAVVAGLFMFSTVVSGAFSLPVMLGERVLIHAKPVSSAEQLRDLIKNQQTLNSGFGWFNVREDAVDMIPQMENAVDGLEDVKSDRDFIGTNNQVENVEEADIVKTDGDMIYYASRYQNKIRILEVGAYGIATLVDELDLGTLYTDSILLTDDYLIVIGYSYQIVPYTYDRTSDAIGWIYPVYTGTIVIYDRTTLEVAYRLETDSNFYQYRLIEDSLFLISNKYINDTEIRPTFRETVGTEEEDTSYLDYDQIYYFEDVPIQGMTVFTGINLNGFDINSQAFLGYVNQIYANEDSLYTAFSYSEPIAFIDTFLGYSTKTQIMKFDIDATNATLTYVAQGVIDGYIENQYWMDEYNGYLRVVTSSWDPVVNKLFILKQNQTTDDLMIEGSITEGLGKPGERVFSVDFQNDRAYVVTFQQIDPRYWIDLSNPKNPVILSATERPGFSTYLHIWNESGSQVVGFGFTADLNGRVNGMEIIASNDDLGVEDSYQLLNQDQSGTWSYTYSEASYNPKALMISPDHGIIAFPVMSYSYTQVSNYEYTYSYVSQYLVFYIDFTQEDANLIISDPIVINHPSSEYYFGIDRGIYISEEGDQAFEVIYTLSNQGMISYNLQTHEILQTIEFELPDWAK